MVFRSVGVYAITASALYAQTKTNYHVTQMADLATSAASLTLLSQSQLATSADLQADSAVKSESGLELQAESFESGVQAEKDFTKSSEENVLGEEYKEEAEALTEKSERDALESEVSYAEAKDLEIQSHNLRVRAGEDRAAAALDHEKAIALSEEAAKAEDEAEGTEEKASELETIALKNEAKSVRDGEALLETEGGAMEDAEAMAACTPIPFLDVLCDVVGTIAEAGYQTVAAYEGAKAAMEGIMAASAQGKERTYLLLAVEKHGEAAADISEANEYEAMAEEETAKSVQKNTEIEAMVGKEKEAQALGNELKEQSDRESAMAIVDEERSGEYFAKATLDEAMAAEEESLSIASQTESEELLLESSEEEFEAQSEQVDAELKQAEAENLLKQSVGHGLHGLALVMNAIVAAGGVVYIVLIRWTKVIIPGAVSIWEQGFIFDAKQVGEQVSGYLLHYGVILGTSATTMRWIYHKQDATIKWQWKTLIYIALAAGLVESVLIHSTSTACRCYKRGSSFKATAIATIKTFCGFVVHLIPTVLLECLILLTLFGPSVFELQSFSTINAVWIWVAIMSSVILHIIIFKLNLIQQMRKEEQMPSELIKSKCGGEEGSFHPEPSSERKSLIREIRVGDVVTMSDLEYGSLEEITVFSTQSSADMSPSEVSRSYLKPVKQYFERLRLPLEILLLCLMSMLIWHCWPLMEVLHPLANKSLGALSSWVSIPVLILSFVLITILLHFLFVH